MKNILAENMLRFGVKNLKESDIRKIEESLLTEAFTDKNGIVWPLFKDQKSVDIFNDIVPIYPNNSAVYSAVFGPAQDQYGKDNPFGGSASAMKRMGTNIPGVFAWTFWHCQALTPSRTAFVIPSTMATAFTTTFKPGIQKTNQYNNSLNLGYKPTEVYEAMLNPENIKWWDSVIEFPKGTRVTRWQLFSQTYLQPNLAKLQTLVVKPVAPAAAKPAMTPGAKPVPGKQ